MTNHRVEGRLHLDFSVAASSRNTRLTVLDARPPSKVIRAFTLDGGAALVHLHNVSGGLLGGDYYELKVQVGAEAHAQITTTSATRIYRKRQGVSDAVQINEVHIAENGLLEMLPDPIIPFAQSAYHQKTHIDLSDGAGLFWWETIAPGREARGEMFAFDLLALELEIRANGRPIALENARLEPALRPLTSFARLGSYRYVSTFYICRVGISPAQWTALESELFELAGTLNHPGETLWGVSTLTAHGLVIRGLSCDGRSITKGLLAFWQAAKHSLYGEEAIPPRKVY